MMSICQRCVGQLRRHTMNRFDTETWKELVEIQNTMTHIDILTITAFMNDDELVQHLDRYRKLTETAA